MLDKNLKRLEFDKILQKLSDLAITDKSKKRFMDMTPEISNDNVVSLLNKTNMALKLIYHNGNIPIDYFSDIELYLKHLESGSSLPIKGLIEIARILRTARNLHEYLYSDDFLDLSEFQSLCQIFDKLYINKNIEEKILNSLLDENTVADTASPLLNKLRKTRKNLEHDIRSKLTNFIHSSTHSKYLMDNIVTIRSERFVVPVKEEYRDKVPGAILDISSSGSTLYIEPSFIYDMNNQINNLKFEENIEIEKILKTLSDLLFPIVSDISNSVEIIYELDFIFTKAKYSISINGIVPIINTKKEINLISARNPLIDKSHVVPIDFSIGSEYSTLLITGPNTGGKTATLKTVGLLELLACCGILIPAKEGSSIFVFDHIYADIGDEQSIQESLSTFSSHMTNIIGILENASSSSLVLLDELGSGTDPIEGSSLAISILEFFHDLNAITVATTHYSELKNYALVTEGFKNASADFDINTLKPTFKLLIGVPGKSNAFAISKSLGLPESIINRAKNFLKPDSVNIENLLKSIYDSKLEIEKEKEEIIKNSNQISLLRKTLENDNSKLNEEAESIIKNAKEKARNILLDAKDDANYIIKELEKNNISISKANSLRNQLNNKLAKNIGSSSILSTNFTQENSSRESYIHYNIGDTVLVNKLNQIGVVISNPDKNNDVKIQIGIMKINVNISELSVVSSNKTHTNNTVVDTSKNVSSRFSNQKSLNISPEINVIGLNVAEAVPIIDKFLDNAYLAHLENVRIVHGKGTGKLRTGIHNFLKTNPHVKDFRVGSFGEGEMGVTIVSIK